VVSDAALRGAIREELLQLQDDLLHTEKAHFAAAERLRPLGRWLAGGAAVCSVAAAASLFASVTLVTGLLNLIAAVTTSVLATMRFEGLTQEHQAAGRQLGALRVRVRHVVTLDVERLSVEDLRDFVETVSTDKGSVDSTSPPIAQRDYNTARTRIQAGTFDRDR
jgi:hypothetical protein